ILLFTRRGRITDTVELRCALGASMTRSVASLVGDRPIADRAGAPDTFPKLLLEHARVRPERPANREKEYGIWQSWSWAEVAADVETLARGLSAVGVGRSRRPTWNRSPAASLRWGSAAATTSQSSATTGRGFPGRSPRRRPW